MIFARREPKPTPAPSGPAALRIAYDVAAFDGAGPPPSLIGQYPQIAFEPLPNGVAGLAVADAEVFIVAVDSRSTGAVEALAGLLEAHDLAGRVIVFLSGVDIEAMRRLIRAGAADVLAAPLSETALAVSLERILAGVRMRPRAASGPGKVIAVLKAGGGVGASALTAQLAGVLAESQGRRVCVADLDLQFGAQALYLDVGGTVTIADVAAATGDPAEGGLTQLMMANEQGVRVLGAPSLMMPLDAVSPQTTVSLLRALRRDFDVTLVDMPSTWATWTRETLAQTDEIVLVTELSVAHAHLVRRQIQTLQDQALGHIPLTLVCNRSTAEAATGVSFRSIEAAIGRSFDVKIPEDRRLMNDATSQGVAIRTLRRGTKLEKALNDMAAMLAPVAARLGG